MIIVYWSHLSERVLWSIYIGAYGEVRKGVHKVTNQIRAIKVISKEKASKVEVERLRIEIEILKRLVIVYEYLGSSQYNQNIWVLSGQ